MQVRITDDGRDALILSTEILGRPAVERHWDPDFRDVRVEDFQGVEGCGSVGDDAGDVGTEVSIGVDGFRHERGPFVRVCAD